jgi:23S rRNA (cytosine1962-C5)-methyltransferase
MHRGQYAMEPTNAQTPRAQRTMTSPLAAPLPDLLARALDVRRDLIDPDRASAIRLFAGFYEGAPELVVDVYADTLVVHNYADPPADGAPSVEAAIAFFSAALPWLRTVVVKPRHAPDPAVRRGAVVVGGPPAHEVREAGVRYSVDLLATRDAGFYLDTRGLRAWLRTEMTGRTLLNAFAYTGALGVAALAGGATRVVQLDVSRAALNVAKTSCILNGLPVQKADFVTADFWVVTAQLRRAGTMFDCVILDPPYFATATTGTVDVARELSALVNKVRPLVADGGHLVVINNALFVPGRDFVDELARLGEDGYLTLETLVPVPEDVTGTATTRVGAPPTDPAPFNHATKIAVLRVKRRA